MADRAIGRGRDHLTNGATRSREAKPRLRSTGSSDPAERLGDAHRSRLRRLGVGSWTVHLSHDDEVLAPRGEQDGHLPLRPGGEGKAYDARRMHLAFLPIDAPTPCSTGTIANARDLPWRVLARRAACTCRQARPLSRLAQRGDAPADHCRSGEGLFRSASPAGLAHDLRSRWRLRRSIRVLQANGRASAIMPAPGISMPARGRWRWRRRMAESFRRAPRR
jgi:hypothetical protein